jgi:hypothetical protein
MLLHIEQLLQQAQALSSEERLELAVRLLDTIHLEMSRKKKETAEPYAFLRILKDAHIQGPPDWSENHDKYIYGSYGDK